AMFAALSGMALGVALVLRFPLIPFVAPFALMVVCRPRLGWRRAHFVLSLAAVLTLQGFSNHLINHEWWYSCRSYYGPLFHWPAALGFQVVETWFARRAWRSAYRALWTYYWAVNSVLVVAAAFVYGKKDRVAPLVFVQARHDATGVVVAEYTHGFPVPGYYLGQPRPQVFVFEDRTRVVQDAQAVRAANPPANYLILYSDSVEVDEARLERALGARLRRDAVIGPSLGDELAHVINPRRNHATRAVVLSLEP